MKIKLNKFLAKNLKSPKTKRDDLKSKSSLLNYKLTDFIVLFFQVKFFVEL